MGYRLYLQESMHNYLEVSAMKLGGINFQVNTHGIVLLLCNFSIYHGEK